MSIKMNYEETRVTLFFDSCLCYLLKEKFRKKHKIKVLSGSKDFPDFIYNKYPREINGYFMKYTSIPIESIDYKKPWINAYQNEILNYLFIDISKLSKKLGISSTVLGTIFFYDDLPDILTKPKIFLNKESIDLTEGEVAIVIDTKTNVEDVMKLKRQAQRKLKNIYSLSGLKLSKKNTYVNPINHIDMTIYREVERHLVDLHDKDKRKRDYGSEDSIMSQAFERAVGDIVSLYGELTEREDDEFLEDTDRVRKTTARITNRYYAIQRRYNLPTKNKINSFLALL